MDTGHWTAAADQVTVWKLDTGQQQLTVWTPDTGQQQLTG